MSVSTGGALAGEVLLVDDEPLIRSLVRSYGSTRHDDRVVRLTEREQAVLRLMAGGPSNAEVAASLYLGVETVKTHVGSGWPSWARATVRRP